LRKTGALLKRGGSAEGKCNRLRLGVAGIALALKNRGDFVATPRFLGRARLLRDVTRSHHIIVIFGRDAGKRFIACAGGADFSARARSAERLFAV
jgi:hypothetical protein